MSRLLSAAAGVFMATVLMAGPAEASPIALALLDSLGHTSGVIVDGGIGDLDATDGIVSFSGPVGEWNVNFTSGATVAGAMSIESFNASGTTATSLFVLFTQLDNTALTSFHLSFEAALLNGSAAYGAFADPANVGFGQSHGIGAVGPFAGSGAFTGDAFGAGPAAGPYSLTQLLVLTGTGTGETAFGGTATLTATPEPASMLLLGSGLALAGLRRAARRRSRS